MSLGKKLITQGGIYASSQLANRLVGLVLIPLYAHMLTKEEYGIVSLMAMVAPFLTLLFSQGLQAAWFRLRFNEDTPEKLLRFETTIVWYLLASVILGVTVISLIGDSISRIVMPGVAYFPIFFLTTVAAGATMMVTLYLRKLQADQRPKAFGVFNFIRTVALLVTIILFVAGFEWGVLGKFIADVVVAIGFAFISLFLIKPSNPFKGSLRVLKESLSYGLPLLPHSLLGQANSLVGRLMIAHYIGLGATGIYSMGHQIANMGVIFATSLNQAYSPLFISEVKNSEDAIAAGDFKEARRCLARVSATGLYMVAATVCISLLLTAYAREVLIILTTGAYEQSWKVTAPVALAAVAQVSYFAFSQSLMFSARGARLMPLVTGATIAVNIGANVILLPRIGFIGSSWAMLAANITMAAVAYFLGARFVKIPRSLSKWLIVYASAITGMGCLYYLDFSIDSTPMRLAAKTGVAAVAIALSTRGAGIYPRDILSLLKRRSTTIKN